VSSNESLLSKINSTPFLPLNYPYSFFYLLLFYHILPRLIYFTTSFSYHLLFFVRLLYLILFLIPYSSFLYFYSFCFTFSSSFLIFVFVFSSVPRLPVIFYFLPPSSWSSTLPLLDFLYYVLLLAFFLLYFFFISSSSFLYERAFAFRLWQEGDCKGHLLPLQNIRIHMSACRSWHLPAHSILRRYRCC
jgi:hypothetical protein